MNENQQYLSTVITDEEIDSIKAGQFNVLAAPRGWGKTTFMFNEKILAFARARKHVLYLVQNKATRDMIAELHKDKAVIFADGNGNGWFINRRKSLWTIEEDEDKVHVMCYQTFAALLRNEGTDWLDDIDLIIWDEFDDIKGYYEKEIKQLKRLLPNFSYEKLTSLLQEGKTNSIINFVYQIKSVILDPAKIKLIAISATPEYAALYFRDYVNYIIKGKLEEKFDAQNTYYLESIIAGVKARIIVPAPGKKYWCFTKYVADALRLKVILEAAGFTVLIMWSPENKTYKEIYTREQQEGLDMVIQEGRVPPQYDFVITTGIVGRSINIYDTSFQDWICNSNEYEDIGQYMRARFNPERQYLLSSARGLIEFTRNSFPADYYQWHNLSEIKELLEEHPIYSNVKEGNAPKKLATFSSVKKEYPDLFEKRTYGRSRTVQYRIKPVN